MSKIPAKKNKLFILRKYIFASSAEEALKLDRHIKPDDCWVDDDWRKSNQNEFITKNKLGFKNEN